MKFQNIKFTIIIIIFIILPITTEYSQISVDDENYVTIETSLSTVAQKLDVYRKVWISSLSIGGAIPATLVTLKIDTDCTMTTYLER